MTAKSAPSAAPAYALPFWVDGHHLYAELRGPHGPYVVQFGRHEITKALTTLFAQFESEGHGEVFTIPEQSPRKIEKIKKLDAEGIGQADRNAAAQALKGLLK